MIFSIRYEWFLALKTQRHPPSRTHFDDSLGLSKWHAAVLFPILFWAQPCGGGKGGHTT